MKSREIKKVRIAYKGRQFLLSWQEYLKFSGKAMGFHVLAFLT